MYTVTYCKYGERRMKPTDIFTNHPSPDFLPPCKNGDSCHDRAPRGSRAGTQGIAGAKDRARIPVMLCEHIVDVCERDGGGGITPDRIVYRIHRDVTTPSEAHGVTGVSCR